MAKRNDFEKGLRAAEDAIGTLGKKIPPAAATEKQTETPAVPTETDSIPAGPEKPSDNEQ